MAGIKRFNMNNYVRVASEAEATMVIIPFVGPNGEHMPEIYLRSKRAKALVMVNPDSSDIEWKPSVQIDKGGNPTDYIKRVIWWFDNATDEYKDNIENTFKDLGDVVASIAEAKRWLLTESAYAADTFGNFIKRKSDVNKFVVNWLKNTAKKQAKYGGRRRY